MDHKFDHNRLNRIALELINQTEHSVSESEMARICSAVQIVENQQHSFYLVNFALQIWREAYLEQCAEEQQAKTDKQADAYLLQQVDHS